MLAIECKNLTKKYRSGFLKRQTITANDNVTFSVKEGEIFGIIGPNGAGKSTTLKIIMQFIRQDEGITLLHNSHYHVIPPEIGYLPENPSLYPHLTLEEHLSFACDSINISTKESKSRIENVLETVQLTKQKKQQIRSFSKGMTQRAGLAYALITYPKILILDEPMSGLDPVGRQLLIDIIKQHNQEGTTILFSSHILNDVERICDKIAIMDKGTIVLTIAPHHITAKLSESNFHLDKTKSPLENLFFHTIQGNTND